MKIEKTVLRAIWPSLVQLERKIRAEYFNLGSSWTKQRYNELDKYIKATLLDTYDIPGIEASVKEELIALAVDESVGASRAMSFDGLATGINTIELSLGQATELIKFPAAGSPLNKWITNLGAGTANRLQAELNQGWIMGKSSRDLANHFQSVMRGKESEAITLSRTWTHDVANRANERVFQENRDVIEGVEWSAVLDDRTCPICGPLDGTKYYFEPGERAGFDDIPAGVSGNRPPRHARCRCELLAITKSWADLVGVENAVGLEVLEERYRPYTLRGGRPVGKGGAKITEVGQHQGDFESWIKKHPSVLRDQVGATRFQMIQDGKVSYKDLLDSQGNFKTLKELRA
uniref:Putative capsid morphogenesis protein n=1 Tax=viral metagenome TaxID=1070528 RepID=A0A6M3KYS7_9ZZZZ